MNFILHHGRNMSVGHFIVHILFDNHQSDTRRAHIFLCSGVNHGELRHIYGLRENVRAHITNQRRVATIRILLDLCAKNCIVASTMEIIDILRHLVVLRYKRIVRCFARGNHIYFAKAFGFDQSAICPSSSICVRRFGL